MDWIGLDGVGTNEPMLNSGAFQILAAATGKARLPTVESL